LVRERAGRAKAVTVFTVNTTDDIVDGNLSQLSLREAVAQADGTGGLPDTIVFDSGLDGQAIRPTGGELTLRYNVRIDGDANDDSIGVTIDATQSSRVFTIVGDDTAVNLTRIIHEVGRHRRGAGSLPRSPPSLLSGRKACA
jgi:CSLREA domain-containing protein